MILKAGDLAKAKVERLRYEGTIYGKGAAAQSNGAKEWSFISERESLSRISGRLDAWPPHRNHLRL